MRAKRLIGFIAIIQSVLFLTHLLLYKTWTFSSAGHETPGTLWTKLPLGFLSVSFVVASLLAFRYTNAALRAFYRVAAVWLGVLSFLFIAAVSSWIIFGLARLAGLDLNFHRTVELLFGAAAVAGLYGVFNASWTRITRLPLTCWKPAPTCAPSREHARTCKGVVRPKSCSSPLHTTPAYAWQKAILPSKPLSLLCRSSFAPKTLPISQATPLKMHR